MTSGMMAGRGFFPPGKGGRRGFPLIGDDFGYFGPNDKPPFHPEFGYPPHFPPPPDGFFPGGPMGFMGKLSSKHITFTSASVVMQLQVLHSLLFFIIRNCALA